MKFIIESRRRRRLGTQDDAESGELPDDHLQVPDDVDEADAVVLRDSLALQEGEDEDELVEVPRRGNSTYQATLQ